MSSLTLDFNPHEREARDNKHFQRTWEVTYFNPHEREARDKSPKLSTWRDMAF